MLPPPVLVVHGYKVKPDGSLELLALQVCQFVLAVHTHYRYIVLIGGMHLAPSITNPSISHAMKEWLVAHGVPADKLLCWDDLPGYIPARDTMEEVDSIPLFLRLIWQKDAEYPHHARSIRVNVVAAYFMSWRVRLLYRKRGALVRKHFQTAFLPSLNPLRLLTEVIALAASIIWPEGTSFVFTGERAKRTFGVAGTAMQPSNWA